MIQKDYKQILEESVISQFRGKVGIDETLSAIAQQFQNLQEKAETLLQWTSVDTAEGELLDYIGFLFGITRDYFDLSQYFCLNVDDLNRSKYFFFRESNSGKIVPRGSLSDQNFRARIHAKIASKFSRHTRNDNIYVIKNMTFADNVQISKYSTMMLDINLVGNRQEMFITDKTLAEIQGVLGDGVGLHSLTINGE